MINIITIIIIIILLWNGMLLNACDFYLQFVRTKTVLLRLYTGYM